eukprot:365257-Chlamydomonas_euryale.AAC.7
MGRGSGRRRRMDVYADACEAVHIGGWVMDRWKDVCFNMCMAWMDGCMPACLDVRTERDSCLDFLIARTQTP